MKLPLGLSLSLAVILFSSLASAQELKKNTWSLGVERLYGITHTTETVNAPAGKVKTSALNYSLLSNPTASQRTVYSSPRLVADYLITDAWSAGLGMGIVGGTTRIKTDAGKQDGASIFGLVLAPRVGFLVAQNSWFAFWPKAGMTFTTSSAKTDNTKLSQYRGALAFEASALLIPAEHVVLSFTPMLDLGVLGTNSTGSGDSIRATALEFGLQGGLGVYF